jgi:hypothetical protein
MEGGTSLDDNNLSRSLCIHNALQSTHLVALLPKHDVHSLRNHRGHELGQQVTPINNHGDNLAPG